jgi:hypothetical protein
MKMDDYVKQIDKLHDLMMHYQHQGDEANYQRVKQAYLDLEQHARKGMVPEDAWTGGDNQWHSEQGDPWKGSDNQWHESAEAGPVECHGYAYNRRDQRVMFTKTFANETAARVWADQHNATILDCRPARTKQEDSNMPVATDSTSPLGGKIDEDYEDYLDVYLAEMRQDGYEV